MQRSLWTVSSWPVEFWLLRPPGLYRLTPWPLPYTCFGTDAQDAQGKVLGAGVGGATPDIRGRCCWVIAANDLLVWSHHTSVLVSLDPVGHCPHWLLPCPRTRLFCGCPHFCDKPVLGSSCSLSWNYGFLSPLPPFKFSSRLSSCCGKHPLPSFPALNSRSAVQAKSPAQNLG